MSLTILQQPTTIHQSIYPEWYGIESDNYADNNFKYKFEINTVNGVLSNSVVYPRTSGGYGFYDSIKYVKNLFDGIDFQPDIITWATCPNSIKNYRIDVEEVNGDGDTDAFTKKVAIKNTDVNFVYSDYICTSATKRFLSDIQTLRRKVDLTHSSGTLRMLSGKFLLQTDTSNVYQILCKRTRGSSVTNYTCNVTNPYYSYTVNTGMNPTNTTLENLERWMLEFPACPYVLNQLAWTQTPGGGSSVSNILQNGDLYSLQVYSLSARSKEMKFEVDSCQSDAIEVFWESYSGGFDFYNFSKVNSKILDVKKSLFNKQRDSINGSTIGHTDFSRGSTQYVTEVTERYILNSDWLTNLEFTEIESLFSSKNVYIKVNNFYYPVIVLLENIEVTTNRKGLRNLTLEVEVSNKKYN